MGDFKPTPEQQATIDAAKSGDTFVVDAVAGSGKTTSAKGMCDAITDRSILYLVFNTAAKNEAQKKFPSHVEVRTTMSLAWRAYADQYADRMSPQAARVPARETAKLAGVTHPFDLGENLQLRPVTLAALATETVDRFCFSADERISDHHFPGSSMPIGLEPIQEQALRAEVAGIARKIWRQAIAPGSKHRFTMAHAFKLMVMGGYDLPYDTIILDEAQDSNPITEKLIKDQQTQNVIIGDPAQQLYCQPLGTQVEVVTRQNSGMARAESRAVPIEDLEVGDRVVTYDNTHVWRNGREITHITRFHHEGELVRVTTDSGLTSTYTPKHNCIVRIDDNLADKYVVYLMRRGDQYRIGRTKMMYSSQHRGFGIVLRSRREKADGTWILSMHDSLGEASLAEMLTQHEFNIPGVHFEPAENDAADIRMFWRKIGDNKQDGERCLARFGLLPESPLWHPGMTQKMGIRTQFPTAAANVMDGMTVLPLRNVDRKDKGKAPRRVWEEVKVSRSYYSGDVVSLEVDDHHNYFGDGILTHNSWRGAVDIMGNFDGPRLPLSKSWRFGEAVAYEAEKWLEHTGQDLYITGNEDMFSKVTVGGLHEPKAVLCRTNGGAMKEAIYFLEEGKRVAVAGGTAALKNLAYAANDLRNGKPTTHPELAAFSSWDELVDYTEEPGGGDLKVMVQLINTYGVPGILDACKKLVNERYGKPEVVVSTAHKAKGLEFSTVRISDDFKEPKPIQDPRTGETRPGQIAKSEAMLHYVAVTRAQHHLDRSGLAWVDQYLSVPV